MGRIYHSVAIAALIFVLVAAPAGAAPLRILGFENGEVTSAEWSWGSMPVAATTNVDGSYALVLSSSNTANTAFYGCTAGNCGTAFSISLRLYVTATPSNSAIFRTQSGVGNDQLIVTLIGTSLTFNGGFGTAAGSSSNTIATATVYDIGLYWEHAAGGAIKASINGTEVYSSTHSSASTTNYLTDLLFATAGSGNITFDSYVLTGNPAGLPPIQKVVGRQGTSTAPSYTAGTKTCSSCTSTNCSGSCATNTDCCATSETPPGTTKNVVVGTAAADSTTICAFSSASCTGAGTGSIAAGDTVQGCVHIVFAKRTTGGGPTANCTGGGAGAHCLLRKIAGTTTSNAVTLTTGDVYYRSPVFTVAANADLDTAEMGMSKGTGTGQNLTLEDQWMECAYTPNTAPGTRTRRAWVIQQ